MAILWYLGSCMVHELLYCGVVVELYGGCFRICSLSLDMCTVVSYMGNCMVYGQLYGVWFVVGNVG